MRPLMLLLHLTDKCNFRCRHCYASAGDFKDELPLDIVKEIIEDFANKGGMICILSGGEPFLYKDIDKVIEKARKEDLKVYITTNGSLIDKNGEIIKKVEGVQISFESSIEKEHDMIRGEGTYKKVLENIQKIPKNIRLSKISIMLTLFSFNARNIDKHCFFFLNSIGVKKVSVERFVAEGRGKFIKYLTPIKKDIKEAFIKLLELRRKIRAIHVSDPIFGVLEEHIEKENIEGIGGCSAGFTALSIAPDGNLTPCTRLFLKIGSIYKNSLWEIWKKSKVLNDLRDRDKLKGKCGSCKFRWICGGCRAAAYAAFGDYLMEDPGCWLYGRGDSR